MKKLVAPVAILGVILISAGIWLFTTPTPSYASTLGEKLTYHLEKVQMTLGMTDAETVLKHSWAASETITSYKSKGSASVDVLTASDDELYGLNMDFNGAVETTSLLDVNAYKQMANIDGSASVEGLEMSGNMDIIMDGTTLYAKLNKIPSMIPMSDKITGTWLRMPQDEQIKEDSELTEAEMKKMMEIFREFYFSMKVDSFTTTTRNGVSAYELKSTLTKGQIIELIKEIDAELSEEDEKLSASDLEEMEKALENMSDVALVSYYDTKNLYPLGGSVRASVDISSFAEEMKQDMPAEQIQAMREMGGMYAGMLDISKIVITTEFDMSDHNNPQNITAPADAQDAEEFFENLELEGSSRPPVQPINPSNPKSNTIDPEMLEEMDLTDEEMRVLRQRNLIR